MNQWLAQVYGTGQGNEDLEKTAQYMLLEKLAAEEGVDLSGVPPEQLDQLAQQVSQDAAMQQTQGQQPGQPQLQVPPMGQEQQAQGEEQGGELPPEVIAEVEQLQAQGVPDEEIEQALIQAGFLADPGNQIPQEMLDQAGQLQSQGPVGQALQQVQMQKEAQAKFEEADFLGRTMAHAYHQELQKIASIGGGLKEVGRSLKHHVMMGGRHLSSAASRAGGAVGRHLERSGKKVVRVVGRTGGAEGAMNPTTAKAIGAGAHVLGGAAGAGTVYAGHKGLQAAYGGETKQASLRKTAGEAAVEALANARAIEILRANGYNV